MDTDPYEPPVKMRPPRQMPGKISDNQEMSQAQESLAWKVRCRSNPEELFSKGILPDKERFANPVFLEQKRRLSIAKTSDTIKKKLVNRPDRVTLQDKNILRSSTLTSPLLQASQLSLDRKRTADRLNQQLSERPGPIDLISKGILPVPPGVGTGTTISNGPTVKEQTFFQKLAKAARRDSYSSNEDMGGRSPETSEPGSNISTDSIYRNKAPTHTTGISPKNNKKRNNKQQNKSKSKTQYNFHQYTASNYHKDPVTKVPSSSNETNESRISRDKKQRSSFEVCVNQQQLLLQFQIMQGFPNMKEVLTPDKLKKILGQSQDAHNLVSDFFTQCKISQIGLQEKNLQELRNICKQNCLPTTGKKAELIDRILNYQKTRSLLLPEDKNHKNLNDYQSKESFSSNESEMKSPQIPLKPTIDDKNHFYMPSPHSLPVQSTAHEQWKKVPLLPQRNSEMPNFQLKLSETLSMPINPHSCPEPLHLLQPSIKPEDCMYASEMPEIQTNIFPSGPHHEYYQNQSVDSLYYPELNNTHLPGTFPSYTAEPMAVLSPHTHPNSNIPDYNPGNNYDYPNGFCIDPQHPNELYSPQENYRYHY